MRIEHPPPDEVYSASKKNGRSKRSNERLCTRNAECKRVSGRTGFRKNIRCKPLHNAVAQAPSPVLQLNPVPTGVRTFGSRVNGATIVMLLQFIAIKSRTGAGLASAFNQKTLLHRRGRLCH